MKLGSGQGFNVEEDLISEISVYPNPSTGILNIDFETNDSFSVEVTNIIGEIVLMKELESNASIDLSNFDKGTYLVKVSNSNLSKTEIIVIE